MPGRRVALRAAIPLLLLAIPDSSENLRLRQLIEKGRHPAIRWSRFSDVQPSATRLYGQNGWGLLWLTGGRPTPGARALLDILATAGDRGLDPRDYDAVHLAALGSNLDRGGADAEQEIRFDAGLTVAALRFSLALARGRVGISARGDRNQPPGFDPVPLVEAVRRDSNPGPLFLALEPSWSPYRELKRALARYRQVAKDSARLQPRVRQIELALERWRWLPRIPGEAGLFLSAPSGRLRFAPGSELSQVVGMSARAATAECRNLTAVGGELRHLIFRPAGTPPRIPVKFPVTDEFFLTGAAPGERIEGGCIHVGDGELLAELLLRDRPEWRGDRVRQAMSGARPMFVRLSRPVPVLFVYGTAEVGENGQVVFFPDAYDHDRRLDALLRRGYPYP